MDHSWIMNLEADLRDILPSVEEKHYASVAPSELPDLLKKIDARENDMSKVPALKQIIKGMVNMSMHSTPITTFK